VFTHPDEPFDPATDEVGDWWDDPEWSQWDWMWRSNTQGRKQWPGMWN